jgi:transcriptional regulator of heat shock response
MQRTIQIKLFGILGILLIGLAISSTATGQTIGSVATSKTTQAASDLSRALQAVDDALDCNSVTDCRAKLKTALERLDKTLDAYEKATKALGFSQEENQARITLDSLKDQLLHVKDLIIAAQDELIKRIQKKDNSVWGRVKRILGIAEKALLIGIGIYVGRGL